MQFENKQLLVGVLIGATLCAIFGPVNQTLMGILAIVMLVSLVTDALKRKSL